MHMSLEGLLSQTSGTLPRAIADFETALGQSHIMCAYLD